MTMTFQRAETVALSLRHELRQVTGPAHERLDGMLSTLNLHDSADRALFDRVQRAGFRRIGAACGWEAAEATATLRRTVDALDEGDEAETDGAGDDPIAADAVAYITLGSQLGLTVLRNGVPPEERRGLLAIEPDIAAWKAFAQRMGQTSPDAEARARILSDATRAFAIFQQEAERHLPRRPEAAPHPQTTQTPQAPTV